MSNVTAEITQSEFVDRFVAQYIKKVGDAFDDGTSVAQYAKDVALTYWSDDDQRADGPEECADNDIYYGVQDNG